MTGPTIVALEIERHTARLPRPWGADVPVNHVIEVRVTDSDGGTGTGFSWTPTIGVESVQALLEHDVRATVLGAAADAATLWPQLWARLHEAGSGGVTTIAMAGVDLALWDLAGRRAGRSLAGLLGRRRDDVEVYGSGVNLHYPLDELLAQVRRWIEAGFGAVKIKVGRPDLGEDVERVAAVRELLGPDRALMIDANQRWDLDRRPGRWPRWSPTGRPGSRSRSAPTTWPVTPSSGDGSPPRWRWGRTCTPSTGSGTPSTSARPTCCSPTWSGSAASPRS